MNLHSMHLSSFHHTCTYIPLLLLFFACRSVRASSSFRPSSASLPFKDPSAPLSPRVFPAPTITIPDESKAVPTLRPLATSTPIAATHTVPRLARIDISIDDPSAPPSPRAFPCYAPSSKHSDPPQPTEGGRARTTLVSPSAGGGEWRGIGKVSSRWAGYDTASTLGGGEMDRDGDGDWHRGEIDGGFEKISHVAGGGEEI
ncbi:hypothetical protein R3P38DRAFT_1453866 [Favolaschia claudopus]|uniref:Uncharacterized protein n=1 Tax=Favolaschia claudopus TaxID=2862362 RepID=A0AAW0AKU5_9AGAR